MIISDINSIVKQTTHKYGIEVPKYINDAMYIDHKNNNTYWTESIKLEMYNVGVSFEVLVA